MNTEERRLKRIGAKISALLEEAKRPYGNADLFLETEAATIYIIDADHEHARDDTSVERRQQAVRARIPISARLGSGAW